MIKAKLHRSFLIRFIILMSVLSFILPYSNSTTTGAVPSFTSGTTASISETTVTGTAFHNLGATDSDGGSVSFRFISQSPASPAKFGVTGSSITTTQTFDYEVTSDRTYNVVVRS